MIKPDILFERNFQEKPGRRSYRRLVVKARRVSYIIINGITLYRITASVVLLCLIIMDKPVIFRWMLALSFFTDSIDGFLARRYKVMSTYGAALDSAGDDLTVLMAVIGAFIWKRNFIDQQLYVLIALAAMFIVQLVSALLRYGKPTSFHTYLAKAAAVLQGVFLILLFFLPAPPLALFYSAAAVTFLELLEEIIMVYTLREWKTDVKGLYWVIRKRNNG